VDLVVYKQKRRQGFCHGDALQGLEIEL